METKELTEKLFYSRKNVFEHGDFDEACEFAAGYKRFMNAAKTEREATAEAIKLCEKAGFREYVLGGELHEGDRVYYQNRGKNLFVFTVGTEPLEKDGIRLNAAHIDSPRLDFKQCPLYEEDGMAFFKTHYYGGIKKYQWVTVPLAIHGVVVKANGEKVEIRLGENEDDPVFYINDILPHLGRAQAKQPSSDAIPGEKLNILIGTRPYGSEKDAVKLNILKILNEKYGITEEDFLSAELCAVPAAKARDIGLDGSLIGAYGHDDKVCAYPALVSVLDAKDSKRTMMCVLADKEEIGSEGVSGMQCDILTDLINEICKAQNANPAVVRANSMCLSADVCAAYDPNFPEVFERRNSSYLNNGVVMCKYTGARGKSSTNDASAEYIGLLRGMLAEDNVIWQTGELGKVDEGGGGTVAMYIAKHNIQTVDLGVPVISMHAPYEVIAKNDLYQAYRAFRAFVK